MGMGSSIRICERTNRLGSIPEHKQPKVTYFANEIQTGFVLHIIYPALIIYSMNVEDGNCVVS